MLGLGGGDAGELTHRGPREPAGGQRLVEGRKLGESARSSEPLLDLPAGQPEDALGILVKARVPGANMHGEPLGCPQPPAKLALERGALGRETDDALVHLAPARGGFRLGKRGRAKRWAMGAAAGSRGRSSGPVVPNEEQDGAGHPIPSTSVMDRDLGIGAHAQP